MYRTRGKRHRMRRKIRRMLWRGTICLGAVLILAGVWKLVSMSVSLLMLSKQAKEAVEEQPEKTQQISASSEGIRVTASDKDSGKLQELLLLVNKDNPLEESWKPDLVKMRDYGVEVDRCIFDDLNAMLKAGEREGLIFWVASGYRSPERQRELLDEDIDELVRAGWSYSEAYEEVTKETMPVGCSEHATGLAVDIVARDYQILDEHQETTAEMKWLQKNCSQYGFILRYPKGKEDITKVDYESWHFRYVGVDAAKEIMEQNITLEEYLNAESLHS